MGRRRACIKLCASTEMRTETTHLRIVAAPPPRHTRATLHASLPLTRDHPQACEPRCAVVFKHYLACADRIEQKGAGVAPASLNNKPLDFLAPAFTHAPPRHAHAIAAPQNKLRRRLRAMLPDWLKWEQRAMPHIV